MQALLTLAVLALVFGFWIPPLLVGRSAGGARMSPRVAVLVEWVVFPAGILAWTVIWIVVCRHGYRSRR